MNQQPNPALKNTAIYVGNDETLRKKAIEFYEKNGYILDNYNDGDFFDYIGTFFNCNEGMITNLRKTSSTIITLPTETETKFPCEMLVSDDGIGWVERLVIGEYKDVFVCELEKYTYEGFNFAKPIPTTTVTVGELVAFYEEKTNTKVIIQN